MHSSAPPPSKKRKFIIPIVGDEDEPTDTDDMELFDMMQLEPEEARKWFVRIDRARAKKREATMKCPSCTVDHPMHSAYHHIMQCIDLRLQLQNLPAPTLRSATTTQIAPMVAVKLEKEDTTNSTADTDIDASDTDTESINVRAQTNTVSPKKNGLWF